METLDKATLFPKIGKVTDVLVLLRKTDPDLFERTDTKLALTGTVKLHGAHNDIVIDAANNIRLQSRNVADLETAKSDAYGFTPFMKDLTVALLGLKKQYHERFSLLNPEIAIDAAHPLVIAGEWIGTGVQKGVAISALSRRFVILAVSINGAWLPEEEYGKIADEGAGIFNISRGGFFHESLDLADFDGSMERMQAATDAIGLECPFAKSFGVDGDGEGIVWKVQERAGRADFWFKTKAPKFSTRPKPKANGAARIAVPAEIDEQAEVLAMSFVTERRLEQGLEYLEELGIERKKRLKSFREWVIQDCMVEEKEDIKEAGVDEAPLKQAISKLAQDWYIGRMKGG